MTRWTRDEETGSHYTTSATRYMTLILLCCRKHVASSLFCTWLLLSDAPSTIMLKTVTDV